MNEKDNSTFNKIIMLGITLQEIKEIEQRGKDNEKNK